MAMSSISRKEYLREVKELSDTIFSFVIDKIQSPRALSQFALVSALKQR
jgi:hypothetical protein